MTLTTLRARYLGVQISCVTVSPNSGTNIEILFGDILMRASMLLDVGFSCTHGGT
jgi:hypothetical protein